MESQKKEQDPSERALDPRTHRLKKDRRVTLHGPVPLLIPVLPLPILNHAICSALLKPE